MVEEDCALCLDVKKMRAGAMTSKKIKCFVPSPCHSYPLF